MSDRPSGPVQRGWAMPLAWPETYCKQTGAWYDSLMRLCGFNRRGYYRVGHAAVVIIDADGSCHYADFGRYHAPAGHGRVRTAHTDHELHIPLRLNISKDGASPELEPLLDWLAGNTACHGSGPVQASCISLSADKALTFIRSTQAHTHHAYGPFIRKGTNCSRFVAAVLLAGQPLSGIARRIRRHQWVSPTPIGLVHACARPGQPLRAASPDPLDGTRTSSARPPVCHPTLPAPPRPKDIPEQAQWLAGEGAGSWYCLHAEKDASRVFFQRFTPEGHTECQGYFHRDRIWDPDQAYAFTYPSHCATLTLIQGPHIIRLYPLPSR